MGTTGLLRVTSDPLTVADITRLIERHVSPWICQEGEWASQGLRKTDLSWGLVLYHSDVRRCINAVGSVNAYETWY